MTAYTLSANTNIDQLTGRAGGDTVNTNGFDLVIDQDTRYGVGGTTSTSFGAITINTTKGGTIYIDATLVRLIPYTGGSGTVPAYNTVISQSGGASGKMIAVMSTISAAPTAPGSAMPATGFIKVKQWNSVAYAAGALTGITATCSGADKAGFIEFVGDNNTALTLARLGGFSSRGNWFDVGSTTGSLASTYQLPTNGQAQYYGGVQVETAVAGVYEWYPNIFSGFTTATDYVRGRFCYISTAGVLRLGTSNGSTATAYNPPAGRGIRCASVLLSSCSSAARTTNAAGGTFGTATTYSISGSNSSVVFEKTNMSFALVNLLKQYSLRMRDSSFCGAWNVSGSSQPVDFGSVCVGEGPSGYTFSVSFNLGGTVDDLVIGGTAAPQMQAATAPTIYNRLRVIPSSNRTSALNMTFAGYYGTSFADPVFGGYTISFTGQNGISFKNLTWFDSFTTTNTTFALDIFRFSGICADFVIDGLSFGGLTNCHPSNSLIFYNSLSSVRNVQVKNIGSPSNPLSLGTVLPTGFVVLNGSGAKTATAMTRVYTTAPSTRTNNLNGNVGAVSFVNCGFGYTNSTMAYADQGYIKGLQAAVFTDALPAVTFDVGMVDQFTSATAGAITFQGSEPTAATAANFNLINGARFDGTGSLYMPTVGMACEFDLGYFSLGHTGFQNVAAQSNVASGYTFAYAINTGAGMSAWSGELTLAALGAALAALGTINPATGFRIKVRVTTSIANSTSLQYVRLLTTSTAAAQNNFYPLDQVTVTLAPNTSLVGAEVRVYDLDNSPAGSLGSELTGTESNPSSAFSFTTDAGNSVWIQIMLPGYQEYGLQYTVPAADASLPIILSQDLNT